MPTLDITGPEPTEEELLALMDRARSVLAEMRSSQSEVRFPIGFEFAGSPKAGKSSIIGLVALFFRRAGFRVSQPPEGASVETPPDLKDDPLPFNVWCGCYAIQNILVRAHEGDPPDIHILDRGLFDLTVWMEYLYRCNKTLDVHSRDAVTTFAMLPQWLGREHAIFLFTADPDTAMRRERGSQLTTKPGRAMKLPVLSDVIACYREVLTRNRRVLPPVFEFDTSFRDGRMPSFQRIAYMVAQSMLDIIEKHAHQVLLVVEPLRRHGFIDDPALVRSVCDSVILRPRFMARSAAERTIAVQQVVPYSLVQNAEGKYLCAKRRTEGERPALAGKMTMLFGGHAEQRDYDGGVPALVFRRCVERELDEELIGLAVKDIELKGLVNDPTNEVGCKHLAFIYLVQAAGRSAIRRQTMDKEFTREAPEWRSGEEICGDVAKFDPWSQLVAVELLGAKLPPESQGALFSG